MTRPNRQDGTAGRLWRRLRLFVLPHRLHSNVECYPMHCIWICAVVLLSSLVLFSPPVFGQQRTADLRGHLSHTYFLEDTPPHAWLVGGAITAAMGSRFRLGVEVLHARMFGRYSDYKERALLVTPVVEYEFSPNRRLNPYLVFGFGYTQYRSLIPNAEHYFDPSLPEFELDKEGGFNLAGGVGVRLFMTRGFFVAPEFRIGLVPVLRSTITLGYSF